MQMVFQNPFDTLNPSHTVGSQLARVIRKFGVESDGDKIGRRVMELLDLVKLPREFARRRPRQLPGRQKQRVGIPRASAGHPRDRKSVGEGKSVAVGVDRGGRRNVKKETGWAQEGSIGRE